ncbi:disks large-associated protein 5 [Grammomys surdaster]|uniref:disks large-associated protein 5 n=1 Tax=Grammomys surdaster TaxID=491861 RepID=UPI0010A00DD1|nr:disks large-associated protein 5 [Grammomys surdaster]
MPVSRFASRLRKDSSTEMIRTTLAHRKSLSQKENRHRVYEQNRRFGLKNVNIPLEGRGLVNIHETSQDTAPEKSSSKTRSETVALSEQRKQLLQKYKEEKQLQKLKEQREKAKRGVFKVGLYRPAAPAFLVTTDQRAAKAEPEKAFPYTGRITRSKAKEHMEQTKTGSRNVPQATKFDQRQFSEKKPLDREKKVVQPMVSTAGKATASGTGSAATQRPKQMTRTVSSTTRKPVTRATNENESERMGPSRGRPAKKAEGKLDKVISSKVECEEKHLDPQTSATNEPDPGGVFQEMENLPETVPAKVKERKSFAPKHCVFQPPCGLKTYQMAPLSPRSASAFLTPSCDQKCLRPEVTTTQDKPDEIFVQQKLDSVTDCSKEHDLNQKVASTSNSDHLSVKGVTSFEVSEGQTSQPQHDVPYFRNILQSETDRLTSRCLEWEKKLELDIPDEAKDLIRTAVGQTRLLIKERFRQFEGLVDNCEYKRGEKETTCTDLDGFWDMVSFQVDDVNGKFNNLIKLEESGWKDNNPSKKVLRKKIVPGRTGKAKQDDDGRAAARSRLAAIKNTMKDRLRQEAQAHTAAPETPKEVDKIVFDAGFFRIESPVKSFSVLSSERHSQRFGTHMSASKVVPEGRAAGALLRQKTPLKKPDPQSSKGEDVDRTFSDRLESRCSHVEDALCPGEQDSSEIEHDVNKINVKMDCFSVETMNLPLPAGDADTNQKEAASAEEGVGSAVTSQDVLMSNPETSACSQRNSSQEAAEVSQSVLLHKSLTSECHLLGPPGLSYTSPCTEETRLRDRGRQFSFGGDLIVFSPLRP